MTDAQLIARALDARTRAYAPYSHFTVGAALEAASGAVYTGCNIENAAYPVGLCAERAALAAAVSAGERAFARIAICGGREGEPAREPCAPCGMCRQALAEFCSGDFEILLPAEGRQTRRLTLSELLPESFGPQNLS